MTDTTSDAIRAELNQITRDLAQAREDLALYERLKTAKAAIDGLMKRADERTAALVEARNMEAKAERDAYFAGLDNLEIVEIQNGGLRNNLFQISYTYPVWDGSESVQTRFTKAGFGDLERRVLEFIIERHPNKIPASILTLAETPADALDRYFVFHKRGW